MVAPSNSGHSPVSRTSSLMHPLLFPRAHGQKLSGCSRKGGRDAWQEHLPGDGVTTSDVPLPCMYVSPQG